ncbi:hypothetical protein [uncultured Jatrophihabitans sp.]|uniref:hypothetical protein n=1 Tax=uncultured Jatrophihabitans sp. TaxID=1610747 RepID=UPI0035C9C070
MILAHSPDWGNVPAWVGAFLTSGSLFLAFTLLLRDRRKEERSQADQVSCVLVGAAWTDPTTQKQVSYQAVKIHNHSTMHIMAPKFVARPRHDAPPGTQSRMVTLPPNNRPTFGGNAVSASNIWELFPGEEQVLELNTSGADDHYTYAVEFTDASNRAWERLLPSLALNRMLPRKTNRIKVWLGL